MAVFQDRETCMTALQAAKENRQVLAEYRVTASEKGLCLGPNERPYEGFLQQGY